MAFAAPALVEGAAAGETAAAASGARAAGAGRATTKGATSAAPARRAPVVPSKTAAARADELVAGGTTRTQARRTLRSEYGATSEQADDLLDAAGGRAVPSLPADDTSTGDGPPGSGPSPAGTQLRVPRSVSRGADAGGGLLLGALGYILGTVYLRGGSAGLKAWFNAKFLNKTGANAPATTKVATGAAPATGGGSNTGSGLAVLGSAPTATGAAGNGASSSGGGTW